MVTKFTNVTIFIHNIYPYGNFLSNHIFVHMVTFKMVTIGISIWLITIIYCYGNLPYARIYGNKIHTWSYLKYYHISNIMVSYHMQ